MADEPEDMVLHLLRDIRSKLDGLDKRVIEMRKEDRARDRRIDEYAELIHQAMGLAAMANIKGENTNERVDFVEDRLTVIEKRLRER